MPVRRLDEAEAARRPVLRQRFAEDEAGDDGRRRVSARSRRAPAMSVIKRPARSCAPAAARRWRSTTACSATPRPSSRAATSWAPPALSLGKFQKLDAVPGLPFEVVRRPTGGRAVLHGEDFEWSFAVVFPGGVARRRPSGPRGDRRAVRSRLALARGRVRASSACASTAAARRPTSARRSASPRRCATTSSPAARRSPPSPRRGAAAACSCTGPCSSGGRRTSSTQVAETLLGEPWQGEGLAGAGYIVDGEMLWRRALARLDAGVRLLQRGATAAWRRRTRR